MVLFIAVQNFESTTISEKMLNSTENHNQTRNDTSMVNSASGVITPLAYMSVAIISVGVVIAVFYRL